MKIKELLNSSDKWIQKDYARNAQDKPVSFFDESACKFCLVGAMYHCYGLNSRSIIDRIDSYLGGVSIPEWNDSRVRKFEDVQELVNKLDI